MTTIHYIKKHGSTLPNNNSSFSKQTRKLITQTTPVHYVNKQSSTHPNYIDPTPNKVI